MHLTILLFGIFLFSATPTRAQDSITVLHEWLQEGNRRADVLERNLRERAEEQRQEQERREEESRLQQQRQEEEIRQEQERRRFRAAHEGYLCNPGQIFTLTAGEVKFIQINDSSNCATSQVGLTYEAIAGEVEEIAYYNNYAPQRHIHHPGDGWFQHPEPPIRMEWRAITNATITTRARSARQPATAVDDNPFSISPALVVVMLSFVALLAIGFSNSKFAHTSGSGSSYTSGSSSYSSGGGGGSSEGGGSSGSNKDSGSVRENFGSIGRGTVTSTESGWPSHDSASIHERSSGIGPGVDHHGTVTKSDRRGPTEIQTGHGWSKETWERKSDGSYERKK